MLKVLDKEIAIPSDVILTIPSRDANFSGTTTPASLSPTNTSLVHSSVRKASNLQTWTAGVDKPG